jgi:hypothetical protein
VKKRPIAKTVLKQVLRDDSHESLNKEVYVDKLPHFIGNVGAELQKEHAKYDEMFRFPLNPAFYKSSHTRHTRPMQAAKQFLT